MNQVQAMYKFGVQRALWAFSKMSEVTEERAREIGEQIGIDWSKSPFTPATLKKGMDVELEHGARDSQTNVTDSDPVTTAKIAWAHLKEDPEYYFKLDKMEKKGDDEEQGPYKPVDRGQVIAWMKNLGTSPEDAQVHDYAEDKGYNTHQLESMIYELAHRQVAEQ